MRAITLKLTAVLSALLLTLSGCGSDDDNPAGPTPNGADMTFIGTVNGQDGVLSGSVTFNVDDSLVTGTFRVVTPSQATHSLLGAYDSTSMALGATGGGYNFAGMYDGVDRLEGVMTGTAMGTFVTLRDDDDAAVAFCGTFAGDDSGIWNFIVDGGTLAGSYTTNSGSFGALDGTVSGNNITIANPLGGGPLATGTISGNNASGTWNDGQGNSGTWTGSRCN